MNKGMILAIALTALSAALPAEMTAKEPAATKAAQSTETFYIQLVSRTRPGMADGGAQLEIGREFVALTGISEGYAAKIKARKFPSLLDGLNHLAVNGWSLVTTTTSGAGGATLTTWVLAKTITERAELLDGLVAE